MDYTDHNEVIRELERAQEDDRDNRERARESQVFLAARDGQWERNWSENSKGKPQYTFDMVESIRDQIVGDIQQSDYDTRVTPAGGESSEDIADTINGLLRMIKSQSDADDIMDRADVNAVTCGFDAVRVITKYCDGDSFDQDLALEGIPNAIDRVYFGYHTEPDASDAMHCFVMTAVPKGDYEDRFDRSPPASISTNRQNSDFWFKPEVVMTGELIYLKAEKQTLVKMTDGSVLVDDESFQATKDELAAAGITEKDRRGREVLKVMTRKFDANGWIEEAKPTVFKHRLPVIPLYENFEIVDEKPMYRGAVEKIIDPQRVLNYSLSREIEEGALAPRAKTWMTQKQAEGFEDSLATLNTNSEPVQFYNPDPEATERLAPQGGAQINPGLRNISQSMQQIIGMSAGMFAANMGDNPGLQSGIAIENLQDRGDRGNNKWIRARERAEREIARVMIKAIPDVYEPDRQVLLMGQDGSIEVATLGLKVTDEDTGQKFVLHDKLRASYSVTVTAAPSYSSRQSQTVKTITEIAQVDPSILEIGSDILLANIPAPGMDDLAARQRVKLLNAGLIPFDQMTREEQAQAQEAANQPQQESPEMVLARAEQAKADAEAQKAQADFMAEQNKAQKIQMDAQFESQRLANEAARLRIDAYSAEVAAQKAGMETRKLYSDVVKTLAEAEAIEANVDAKVTRIDELMGGAG